MLRTRDSLCPALGGGELLFSREADPRIVQQAELVDHPLIITEHQMLAYWCPHCRKVHYASMPEAVAKTGLFGPRLTTLVAFMTHNANPASRNPLPCHLT